MKFGVFDYIEGSDQPLHQTYEERLVLVRALETLAAADRTPPDPQPLRNDLDDEIPF